MLNQRSPEAPQRDIAANKTWACHCPQPRHLGIERHRCIGRAAEGKGLGDRQLLLAEGIAVDGEGRLPLGRYLWVPPLELALDG